MNRTVIPRVAAKQCVIPGLPKGAEAIHAVDAEGRRFYAKTQGCPNTHLHNPTWIANELIYYVIARESCLPMPEAAVLEINGQLCWGSEVLNGRNRIPTPQAARILREVCQESKDELLGLARALLLDLALLNSDRKPSNMLVSRWGDGRPKLWYFDHDKSLLGDGLECKDLARIDPASVTDSKVSDYFACVEANDLVFDGLSDKEICGIMGDLALNDDALALAREQCPGEWLSEALFSRLEGFLRSWWGFVHGRLKAANPKFYLGQLLRERCLLSSR